MNGARPARMRVKRGGGGKGEDDWTTPATLDATGSVAWIQGRSVVDVHTGLGQFSSHPQGRCGWVALELDEGQLLVCTLWNAHRWMEGLEQLCQTEGGDDRVVAAHLDDREFSLLTESGVVFATRAADLRDSETWTFAARPVRGGLPTTTNAYRMGELWQVCRTGDETHLWLN